MFDQTLGDAHWVRQRKGQVMAEPMTIFGIPVLTLPPWKLALLRLRYRHQWYVQRGANIYIIRDIPEDN